jgi:type IV pilus assembly protein PilC
MKFKYTGVTRQRERVQGIVDAQDAAEARLRLRSMQIRSDDLVEVREKSASAEMSLGSFGKLFGGWGADKVPLKKLILFTRQLSSLIDSGVPVVQCLDILFEQERSGTLKKILLKIKQEIESGNGFATSLGKHPTVFSEFFVRIIEAGELSGTLDKAIKQVGLQLEKLSRLKAKVVKAMTYPILTLFVAVCVVIFLLVKVVPEIAKLYSEGKAKLPDLTIFVMAASTWTQENYPFIVGGALAAFTSGSVLYRTEKFRAVFDPFLLKVPLFGPLVMKSAVAQLTRTLSTLVSSGVPLLSAFEICGKLMTNRAIKDALKITASFVQEGRTISAGLAAKGIFPAMVIHMVNIGEMTGRLDDLLNKVAGIYDDEVDDAIEALTGLLQPAIIVVVGVIIAFLLVAMYLPVFQLADRVSGG